jgi:hypothetical protein
VVRVLRITNTLHVSWKKLDITLGLCPLLTALQCHVVRQFESRRLARMFRQYDPQLQMLQHILKNGQ